jgi:hypothetical protein
MMMDLFAQMGEGQGWVVVAVMVAQSALVVVVLGSRVSSLAKMPLKQQKKSLGAVMKVLPTSAKRHHRFDTSRDSRPEKSAGSENRLILDGEVAGEAGLGWATGYILLLSPIHLPARLRVAIVEWVRKRCRFLCYLVVLGFAGKVRIVGFVWRTGIRAGLGVAAVQLFATGPAGFFASVARPASLAQHGQNRLSWAHRHHHPTRHTAGRPGGDRNS